MNFYFVVLRDPIASQDAARRLNLRDAVKRTGGNSCTLELHSPQFHW